MKSDFRLLILGCVLTLGACGGIRPPKPPDPHPTPTPTPEPTPPPSASLLLSRNATQFTDQAGKPVDLKGTARCCFTDDSEEDKCDPGWALVSRCAIKDTADRAGANSMIHLRLGPYRVQPDWGAEQNSAGSPYLEVNGKADLSQWDPRFEVYLSDKATYAASLGVRLEVDLIDGWGIKWQKWRPDQFPQGHPWMPGSNLQGQNWISGGGCSGSGGSAGETGICAGSVWDRWVRHAVDMMSIHDNVIYQVGNEDDQIPGIVAAWETSICDAVHDEEAKRGLKRHLCGSNAPGLASNNASIDFLTTHVDPPFSQLSCGDVTRPCRQNEDNNNYSGTMWGSLYCEAKSKGIYRDLWRAEMHRPDFNKAFEFLKNGCAEAVPIGCYNIPNEDSIQVLPKPPAEQANVDAVNGAMTALKPECAVGSDCAINAPIQNWLNAVASKIRQNPNMCAGIQTVSEPVPGTPVDQICVGAKVAGADRCDICQGFHVYSCSAEPVGCTQGKVGWAPGSYSRPGAGDTWKRPGAAASTLATAAARVRPDSVRVPDWKHGQDRPISHDRPKAVVEQ